jgi:hypothetical protein
MAFIVSECKTAVRMPHWPEEDFVSVVETFLSLSKERKPRKENNVPLQLKCSQLHVKDTSMHPPFV